MKQLVTDQCWSFNGRTPSPKFVVKLKSNMRFVVSKEEISRQTDQLAAEEAERQAGITPERQSQIHSETIDSIVSFCAHFHEMFILIKHKPQSMDDDPDWYSWEIRFNTESISQVIWNRVQEHKNGHEGTILNRGQKYQSTEHDLPDPGRKYDWKSLQNATEDRYREWMLVERILVNEDTDPEVLKKPLEENQVRHYVEAPEFYLKQGTWQGFSSHRPSLPQDWYWVHDVSHTTGRPMWKAYSACHTDSQICLIDRGIKKYSRDEGRVHAALTETLEDTILAAPTHVERLRRVLKWEDYEKELGDFKEKSKHPTDNSMHQTDKYKHPTDNSKHPTGKSRHQTPKNRKK